MTETPGRRLTETPPRGMTETPARGPGVAAAGVTTGTARAVVSGTGSGAGMRGRARTRVCARLRSFSSNFFLRSSKMFFLAGKSLFLLLGRPGLERGVSLSGSRVVGRVEVVTNSRPPAALACSSICSRTNSRARSRISSRVGFLLGLLGFLTFFLVGFVGFSNTGLPVTSSSSSSCSLSISVVSVGGKTVLERRLLKMFRILSLSFLFLSRGPDSGTEATVVERAAPGRRPGTTSDRRGVGTGAVVGAGAVVVTGAGVGASLSRACSRICSLTNSLARSRISSLVFCLSVGMRWSREGAGEVGEDGEEGAAVAGEVVGTRGLTVVTTTAPRVLGCSVLGRMSTRRGRKLILPGGEKELCGVEDSKLLLIPLAGATENRRVLGVELTCCSASSCTGSTAGRGRAGGRLKRAGRLLAGRKNAGRVGRAVTAVLVRVTGGRNKPSRLVVAVFPPARFKLLVGCDCRELT